MSNLKFKHLFKNKIKLMCFIFVCGLLITEKTFAFYDKACCSVHCNISCIIPKNDYITIFFKFFEYEKKHGDQNSFLKEFEVKYSTNNGTTYHHLMSASTKNQTSKTWAWIEFKEKKTIEKIELYSLSRTHPNIQTTLIWNEGTNPKLEVSSEIAKKNEAWCGIRWYAGYNHQNNVTHIQIKVNWYNHEKRRVEDVTLNYNITPAKTKLISKSLKFSNSSSKSEITNEAKSNKVKAYKNVNLIIVKGALRETIRVYTTTEALVKLMVSDCDLLQILVRANNLYMSPLRKVRFSEIYSFL